MPEIIRPAVTDEYIVDAIATLLGTELRVEDDDAGKAECARNGEHGESQPHPFTECPTAGGNEDYELDADDELSGRTLYV